MARVFTHRMLVLNRLWQAVNIIGVRRGFSLLCQGHANAILTADKQFRVMDIGEWVDYSLAHPTEGGRDSIQTVRYPLRIPKVLLLKDYDRVPLKEVRFGKEAIFERDGHRCQYCGNVLPEHLLNLDHVIPRDMGGKTNWENVVTSCIECNTRKANRMPHQANMNTLRLPVRPKRRPFANMGVAEELREADWLYFLPSGQR